MRALKGAETEVTDLAFSPDGRAVAAGFDNYHGVYLWNLEAATPAPVRLSAQTGFAGGLHFSSDGRSVKWRSIGGVRTYHRGSREYVDHSFAGTRVTHDVGVSGDDSRAVSQHGMPSQQLIGWHAHGDEWVQTWQLSIADLAVYRLTLSADGALLGALTRDATGERWATNPLRVRIWDAATGVVLGCGEYPYSFAEPLVFSPDCRQLVGRNRMSILVWPVPKLGEPRRVASDNRKDFTSTAFDPSGRRLYATSNDTTVHVFDTATWERTTRYTWHLGRLKSIATSRDGTLAAAGGDRGDIVIWDLDE